jgi:cobalt-zinc-cadmium efflux system protein
MSRAESESPTEVGGQIRPEDRLFVLALVLIMAFMAFEVAMSVLSGSLALLSDAGHMLTDAGALAGSLFAMRLARRPASGSWTYGYKRAEILSAQANGYSLLVIALILAYEAVRRLVAPSPVNGTIMVMVAAVGVVVNLALTLLLARADRRSLNVEGAFKHILTDLYAFAGTLLAGIVIVFTHFERADAIASLFVVAIMLRAATGLIRRSGRVLLEGAPEDISAEETFEIITSCPGVDSVHDAHLWTITSGLPAMSAHVLVSPGEDCHAVRQRLERELASRKGITHTTLQVDHAGEIPLTIGPKPAPKPGDAA